MNTHDHEWAKHPLFQGLPAPVIETLARSAREVTYQARDSIFHEGDSADLFYLVASGIVAIEVFAEGKGPFTIQTVTNGEILGWSWLLEPHKWHFDAQVTTPTTVIEFDAAALRATMARDPAFGYAVMQRFIPIIVERLQATRMQLLDVYHVQH
jgi:CRP-like cAMP-binding protein